MFSLLPALFSVHIIETGIVMTLGLLLLRGNIIIRLILYCFLVIYISIVFVQFYSFYYGKEFLSQVAIENIDHIELFFTPRRLGIVAGCSLMLVVLVFFLERGKLIKPDRLRNGLLLVAMISMVFSVTYTKLFLPSAIDKKRGEIFRLNSLEYIGPVTALYEALFVRGSIFGPDYEYPRLSMKQFVDIERFGFDYRPREEYPLITNQVYSSAPPFPIRRTDTASPNVIIFFTEGFSARSIGSYGSKYKDLTPNIDAFSRFGMRIDNYFNHTAATYRGLHGQLCSIYPEFSGGAWMKFYDKLARNDYYCLNDVFEQDGYETVFLDSHHKDHMSRVDEMVKNLGFSEVITGDVLAEKYLEGEAPYIKNAYSDRQFMRSLISFLKDKDSAGDNARPFMISLYNFGTHAMLPVTEDGRKYGDGSNESLNTIHSYDAAFGNFWEYFKTSPYAKNTIIILTADHCHYPEKPFVDAFDGPDYQPYFVDRIPLIIYDPTRDLPEVYDVNYATSIDFAPSIIHYLGLGNVRNSFLGSSFFEAQKDEYDGIGVAYFGSKNFYLIDDKQIYRLDFPVEHKEKLRSFRRFVSIVKRLELKNKIWDGDS